jgi:CBS domain-containing protein
MDIRDICKPVVVFGYKHMALNEAARLMRDHHVGSLVVIEERESGKMPIGMLTDRDITVSVVARDLDARILTVGEVMTPDVVAVRDDDSIVDALALMRRRGIRRAPVVTRAGVLAGIVTLDDLLRIVVAQLDDLVGSISVELDTEARERP